MLSECQNTTPYRVVQWTTGNVGKSSVQAIAANDTLELVGCYAWSDDEVGELCGIARLRRNQRRRRSAGVKAGRRRLQPDDELVRMLEAGVNVVATASFITGHNQGEGHDRIA